MNADEREIVRLKATVSELEAQIKRLEVLVRRTAKPGYAQRP